MENYVNNKIRYIHYFIFVLIIIYILPKHSNFVEIVYSVLTNQVTVIYLYLTILYEVKNISKSYTNENLVIRNLSKKNHLKYCNKLFLKAILLNLLFYITTIIIGAVILSNGFPNFCVIAYFMLYILRYIIVFYIIIMISINLMCFENIISVFFIIFNCLAMLYYEVPFDFVISKIGIREIFYINFLNKYNYSSIIFEVLISSLVLYTMHIFNSFLSKKIVYEES